MVSDGHGWVYMGARGCVWVYWSRRTRKTGTQGHAWVKCSWFPGHYGREISPNTCMVKHGQGAIRAVSRQVIDGHGWLWVLKLFNIIGASPQNNKKQSENPNATTDPATKQSNKKAAKLT